MYIRETLDKFFDSLITIGTEGVMKYLSVQFPFSNTPVIKQIIKMIVKKVMTLAMKRTELGAYFAITGFKVGKERDEFEKAALDLEEAKKKGNADEIAKMEQAKIDAARKLIRINPY